MGDYDGTTLKVADDNGGYNDFIKDAVTGFGTIINYVQHKLVEMRLEEGSKSSLHAPTLSFPNSPP
jgi:hypothetical protein